MKQGYQPETVRLHYNIETAADHTLVEAACHKLQAEMLEWSSGHRRNPLKYDGTIRSLIRAYQADPASPYVELKWNSRRTYDEILDKIERALGARVLPAIDISDFRRWYDEAKKPKAPGLPERITKAHKLIGMFRRLLAYGVMAENKDCRRLLDFLEHARFKGAARRRKTLELQHVQAFIPEAIKAGRISLAIGTALQFETGMRQKDVIGEWEQLGSEEMTGGIILNRRRWVNGMLWTDIEPDFTFNKFTTKTGAAVANDLKLCPMTLKLLEGVPKDRRIGPLIIDENAKRPYAPHGYAREWRKIARLAEIPDDVWNMDARAGAITEAENAGAEIDTIRSAVGHSQSSTTLRYSRGAIGKSRAVAKKRIAHRTNNELK